MLETMSPNTTPTPLVVIKAGGSLLGREGGLESLRVWLASPRGRATGARRVLLLGGGPIVDGLRHIDHANPLPTESTHWAAIEILDTVARTIAPELPGFELTTKYESIREGAISSADLIFAPGDFLWEHEPVLPGTKLPTGWESTSDSIAGRLAACLGSPLVLLKSSWPESLTSHDWSQAAESGCVDRAFPLLVGGVTRVVVEVLE